MTTIDIAIFAHNEADRIGSLLADLARQDVFCDNSIDLRVLLLANGCSDDTVSRARHILSGLPDPVASRFAVHDLPEGGKSRTGHRFIHEFSRPEAETLGFMDGDIRLPQESSLRLMIGTLGQRPELVVLTSRPVKDVRHNHIRTGLVGRLVAAGGDGLTDWRKSICGQLFMMRTGMARRIGLPGGLPVEDGFFRAMVLTDLLSRPEDLSRIDGHPEVFHVYESVRTLDQLIRHQTRIVVGSAVNAALYRKIRREAPGEEEAHSLLMQAAQDPAWLERVLQEELPRQGYVPKDFLTKRWKRWRGGTSRGPRALAMLVAGLGLDGVVWLNASWKMRRGTGAGHW